ncbi:TlpA family protein disulfide reductase [Parapedobacter defluvii]|nr:TlpA disulfide reductase family protein [Parapedobacter defluvii]
MRSDSLQLIVFGHSYLEGLPTIHQVDMLTTTEPVADGICHFVVDLEATPHYYLIKENQGSFIESKHIVLRKNILTGGDDVLIQIGGDSTLDFSGKGARKMVRFNELPLWCSREEQSISKEIAAPVFPNKELTYVYHYFEQTNRLSKLWMNRLADEKPLYSDEEYQLLLADGVSYIQKSLIFAVEVKALLNKSFSRDEIGQITKLMDQKIIDLRSSVSESILARSDNWIKFMDKWISVDQKLKHDRSFSKYDYLKKNYSGGIRDKLTMLYLIKNAKYVANVDSLAQDFIATSQDESYTELLSQVMHGRTKGKKAKDFSLFDQYGNQVKLTDFYGKVVFLDFWFPGCFPCMKYFAETISYAEEKFKHNPDVIFISIGICSDKGKWMDALQTNKYTSPSAINLFTGEAGWNHPVIMDYAITSAPTPMVIDKSGHIFSTNSNELGKGNKEKLIETIDNCLAQ